MQVTVNQKERDCTYDVMKGIGIFLMVLGHTIGPESTIHRFIYAFHMPLFFILSGFFTKQIEIWKNVVKLFNRLLKPVIFIYFNVLLIKGLHHYLNTDVPGIDWDFVIYGKGPGWFLLALFWGRIIFNILLTYFSRRYLFLSLFISLLPMCLTMWTTISMPFNILQGLTSIIFIAIGYYVKQNNILQSLSRHNKLCIALSLLFWLNTSIFGEIEMSTCHFKLWMIDCLGAVGGTFLCLCLSKSITRHLITTTKILTSISIFSLAIYAFHSIDFCIPTWHKLLPFVNKDYMVYAVLLARISLFYPIILSTDSSPILYRLFVGKHLDGQNSSPPLQNNKS